MIFSSRSSEYFDKHIMEHISYVIRQCVLLNNAVSLSGVSKYDTHNIYYFESTEIPSQALLKLFSIYFDSMSIDVNKERTLIKLVKDFNKDIPF